jgi:hypothetical protein
MCCAQKMPGCVIPKQHDSVTVIVNLSWLGVTRRISEADPLVFVLLLMSFLL